MLKKKNCVDAINYNKFNCSFYVAFAFDSTIYKAIHYVTYMYITLHV